MRQKIQEVLKHFAIELLLYSVLVFLYFFLVLHFLGGWIYGLFTQEREVYAAVALALMLGQGIALELLTTGLLQLIRTKGGR